MAKKSAFQQRSAAVKQAHAELARTRPGFRDLPPHRQFQETQQAVRTAAMRKGTR